MVFAEVIGDPIAQSKSPAIHRFWLNRLGIVADYVRTSVAADELPGFLKRRRADPDWRGCNVTIPHKQAITSLLDRLDPGAGAIGAVNCVVPEDGALIGHNTDIDGVAAALDSTELRGRKVALIGAGGGARAVVAYLEKRGVERIANVARNWERAEALRSLAARASIRILPFEQAEIAFGDGSAIINASPLGMAGADPMPQDLLSLVRRHASGATIFDLVTTPVETEFLRAGRAGGEHIVDGLTMLVGQAARAFELFFGAPAPPSDEELRNLLIADRHDSAGMGYKMPLTH
jgi:shikimate dehydrogenase